VAELTLQEIAKCQRRWFGGVVNSIPSNEPDLAQGGAALIAGLGLGGANAIAGQWPQDVIGPMLGDLVRFE
jgi:hypothetical protein